MGCCDTAQSGQPMQMVGVCPKDHACCANSKQDRSNPPVCVDPSTEKCCDTKNSPPSDNLKCPKESSCCTRSSGITSGYGTCCSSREQCTGSLHYASCCAVGHKNCGSLYDPWISVCVPDDWKCCGPIGPQHSDCGCPPNYTCPSGPYEPMKCKSVAGDEINARCGAG